MSRLIEGRDLRRAGRYREATAVLREVLERAVAGIESVAALNELGIVMKYTGDLDEAQRLYEEAVRILDAHRLRESAQAADLLHNLAGLAHSRRELEAAEALARAGIRVRLRLRPADSLTVSRDRAAFAAILVDAGRPSEAVEVLNEVREVYVSIYGPVHHEIAVVLHNLGSAHAVLGDYDAAADCLQEAVAMKERVLGGTHPEIATTLHNLACVQLAHARRQPASANLERCVAILASTVNPDHPTLVSARRRLDAIRLRGPR
ncbi:tetratricopeptide repeat protein [Kribbella sp. NPDC051770]|uniref:tetratricopeptide repeat protein n=1 Tax=Kribbella sp. NPDC051770 TaxID=3155413 RepID=UPI0034205B6B